MMYSGYAEFILPVVHTAWLSGLASPACGGATKRILSMPPLKLLGDVSYALYCLHFPVLQWAVYVVRHRGVSYSQVPLYHPDLFDGYYAFPAWALAPLVAISLAVAELAHMLLERPARRRISGVALAITTKGPLLPVSSTS
jgi:peptidoglycan/LPS O-acetylase OafA/YrhL